MRLRLAQKRKQPTWFALWTNAALLLLIGLLLLGCGRKITKIIPDTADVCTTLNAMDVSEITHTPVREEKIKEDDYQRWKSFQCTWDIGYADVPDFTSFEGWVVLMIDVGTEGNIQDVEQLYDNFKNNPYTPTQSIDGLGDKAYGQPREDATVGVLTNNVFFEVRIADNKYGNLDNSKILAKRALERL